MVRIRISRGRGRGRGRNRRRESEHEIARVVHGSIDEEVRYSLDGRGHVRRGPLFVFYKFCRLGYSGLVEGLEEGFGLCVMPQNINKRTVGVGGVEM